MLAPLAPGQGGLAPFWRPWGHAPFFVIYLKHFITWSQGISVGKTHNFSIHCI